MQVSLSQASAYKHPVIASKLLCMFFLHRFYLPTKKSPTYFTSCHGSGSPAAVSTYLREFILTVQLITCQCLACLGQAQDRSCVLVLFGIPSTQHGALHLEEAPRTGFLKRSLVPKVWSDREPFPCCRFLW